MGSPVPETTRPEIKLTPAEKRAVFDWSPERRKGVVDGSKMKLRAFLAENRKDDKRIDDRVAAQVSGLWTNAVNCFQDISKKTSPLVLNGEEIVSFKPNILPTHSEYHVSKVLTLSTQLFDIAPKELKTQENALAVSLATIVHDVGSLLQGEETGPQEKMYKFHELRAIALVDKVVNALYRDDKGDHQQLKNKIKMLIAATVPKWNLDFSPARKTTISKLLDPNHVPPITLDNMRSDLFLNSDTSDDTEIVNIKEQLHGQADELYNTFDTLRKSGDEKAIREMRYLTHLMGAADHGAYMLEPSNIAEVFGLWQEQQTEWEGVDGRLTHRKFTNNAETSYKWFTSLFTDTQWGEFGSLIRELGINPFAPDTSIQKSKDIADHVRSILREDKYKPAQDALSRVEGAFSPVELDNLAQKLGLENNVDIKNAIITFSQEFAHRFAEPHNFDALSTKVLKLIYDATPEKSTFLKEVLEAIIVDSVNELIPDGTLNIHIAPFAYTEDAKSFTQQISKAYEDLPLAKQQRIKSIIFTIREEQPDSVQALISNLDAISKPPVGFALGGIPKDPERISLLLDAVGPNRDSVIHFGLEKEYPLLEKRLNALLIKVEDAKQKSAPLSHFSIHIDDGYEHFNTYIEKHPENKELLDTLIKSVSPLGYLLTRGNEGFNQYQKFAENFKGVIVGSNNACMKGGYRIAVENLVQILMNEGILNQ